MGSFKQCTKCGVKIPKADGHDKCVLCLGEAHVQGSCAHCKAMSAQALKNRDRTLMAALYKRVLSQPGGSGASGESDAPKAPKRRGDKRSDQDKKRARSSSPPSKSRRKGPPSTVSVPPPESRPVPSTSPVAEPVKTPTPSLPAPSRMVPLEPRVLLTSHLSVPADSPQIVNVDSESEGELQDSYAPFSPQRPRSKSPSPSPRRRPRSASRDQATLGTEADEALAADHPVPTEHDRDLFQAFPDLIHDQHPGQYLIPVDPSHLHRNLRAHSRIRRPDDETSRQDDWDDLGASDPLFRRCSPSPSKSGSGSPRSVSTISDEDAPFVPEGPSVPSPTDDVRAFADRVIRMADALKLEVAHPEDDALDPVERRIHGSAPAPPALAYLPSLEKIAKRSWDSPATIPSTSRKIENLYRVTPSAPSWLSHHPKLNSAIVEGAQSTFAPKTSSSPVDKDSKKLDGLAKKFYTSAALDLKIANYAACMGAYVQFLVEKMDPTIADLPDDRRRMMAALGHPSRRSAHSSTQRRH
ncbi:arginine-glutamic acid dipeptide repeats protein-like [Sceloporus undulatus]|uniref:arginine-glutamic acid dipeptide repeats protein-like n=1 Tax=Sceloporus undulatus TaxID=8520 RepID=UPI001C4C6FB2|nr:arginine-glutamic acid dipeptide repeats protein-like [Sceloporus undulatus]